MKLQLLGRCRLRLRRRWVLFKVVFLWNFLFFLLVFDHCVFGVLMSIDVMCIGLSSVGFCFAKVVISEVFLLVV